MAYTCDRCGKGILIGRQHRHKRGVAGGRWKKRAPGSQKISKPNLHAFRGVLAGQKGKWRLCTKCLRTVKKGQKEPQKQGERKDQGQSKPVKEKKKSPTRQST
jgi:ribosomal protein L28